MLSYYDAIAAIGRGDQCAVLVCGSGRRSPGTVGTADTIAHSRISDSLELILDQYYCR